MPGAGLVLPWWVGPLVMLFGALFLAMGGSTLVGSRRRQRNWLPQTGRVVGSRLDGDGQIRAQIAFHFEGRPITFWNRFTTGTGIDPVGRDVDILVNPADPTDAVVVRGAGRPSVVGWAFVAFGVIAVVVGIILIVTG